MGGELDFMQGLAKKAGKIQLKHLGRLKHIEYKSPIDLVTETDRECEKLIVGEIRKRYPDDSILAEEGSGSEHNSGRLWCVDPLDGTVNYAHGFPFFCVSIGLLSGGEIIAGVIYDPNRGEMFTAEKGKGARMNGRRIHVSKTPVLKQALLATGFACLVYAEDKGVEALTQFGKFLGTARAVRRPGSAATDLAWAACGRVDGFWEEALQPWDMAAGVLLIREAGGVVTKFDGSEFNLHGDEILVSNGSIHPEMIKVLQS